MIQNRVGFGQFVALSLAREHMQKLPSFKLLQVLQRGNEGVEIILLYFNEFCFTFSD